jgi:uncharacterized protein YegJ (DUF2314 family)
MRDVFGAIKKWMQRRQEKSEIVAIILLQAMPRLMDRASIESTLKSAGINIALKEEQISYLRGAIDGFELTIASIPMPYVELKRARFAEQRLSDACASHVAFTTIDAWKSTDGRPRTDARPIMAKIAAALTDEYVVAYYDWTSKRLFLPDSEIVSLLTEGKIEEAIEQVGDVVFTIASEDEQIEEAIAEAQRRWPEFVEAFGRRSADDIFTAKASFTHGDAVEHLWMEVSNCDLNNVTGRIANKPYNIPRPNKDDVVIVPAENVSDWLMSGPDGPIGGFVERILHAR